MTAPLGRPIVAILVASAILAACAIPSSTVVSTVMTAATIPSSSIIVTPATSAAVAPSSLVVAAIVLFPSVVLGLIPATILVGDFRVVVETVEAVVRGVVFSRWAVDELLSAIMIGVFMIPQIASIGTALGYTFVATDSA